MPIITDREIQTKAMNLEFKLEDYLRRDNYIGKNSRVFKLFIEVNALWMELARRARLRILFRSFQEPPGRSEGTLGTPDIKGPVRGSNSLNPYN